MSSVSTTLSTGGTKNRPKSLSLCEPAKNSRKMLVDVSDQRSFGMFATAGPGTRQLNVAKGLSMYERYWTYTSNGYMLLGKDRSKRGIMEG